MDIHSARQQLKMKSIYDLPLRVTFYARVSSESDEQLNSLGKQISYYEDFIRKNANWTYVDGYIDEGLSAATTKKRENFYRMVDDGNAGKFDLVITKEITRFARNTLDSITFTQELLAAGVGVFFQNDNINTLDEDSELRLTTMSGMISNPKYKGYYVGNKVRVLDTFTKKQKFLPPEEWVMFKDETGAIVPALVDEAIWDEANKVLKKRSDDVKNRQGICNHANLLTGKLFCTDCGAAYYRRESKDREGNKNSKWVRCVLGCPARSGSPAGPAVRR